MLTGYHPEMNETKPENTQIDAQLSHSGKHWFLRTPLTLSGRGVEFLGQSTPESLVSSAQHKAGWNKYKVTEKAFDAICAKYNVATEMLL